MDFERIIIALSKTYKIPFLEPDDIAQELRIHLWLKRDKYDPKRAKYNTWATKVCKRKIWELARYYKRNNRDSSKFLSIEEMREKGRDIEG